MNTIDFTKQGGFPLDQDVLGFLQESSLTAAKTASLGGSAYVLSGCEQAGNNIANGIVVINGEILPFAGGATQEKVVVIEQTEDMNYEDGSVYPSIKTRYATFGDDGVTGLLWAGFKRNTTEGVLARLDRLERIAAPFSGSGGMVLWKKPAIDIPVGWQEVVDWRGRLPMGYDPTQNEFNEVGKAGGDKQRTLTTLNLPAHDHSNGNFNGLLRKSAPGSGTTVSGPDSSGAGTEPDAVTMGTLAKVGSDQPFSLLNPYRVVMFIEYIGD